MKIIQDDLSSDKVAQLLSEHLEGMRRHSPAGSVFALDLSGLRAPEITFWTVWQDDELLGFGALREIDASHGEVKSMRTAGAHLGKGVAKAMLRHLVVESRARNYERLSLETGSGPAFRPAESLYRAFGFTDCPPFANYSANPFSRFMTLEL